jgi:VWFA-related protein
MLKRRLLAMGILLFVGVSLGAPAQNPQTPAPQTGTSTPPQNGPSRIIATATAVIVPVTVKDGDGRLVADLTKDDFRILCDSIQQRILLFSSEPFPLSAVIVLDNDLGQSAAKQVQKSLSTISAGFGPNDEVAVVTYEEFPTTLFDFSNDNDSLFTALKRLDLDSHPNGAATGPTTLGPIINGKQVPNGGPGDVSVGIPPRGTGHYKSNNDMDDALYQAGEMLKDRGRGRRKMIFLISDGADARDNKHGFADTLRSLLAADVSVYAINTSHSYIPVGKRLLEHGTAEIDRFADRTGGDTFVANKADDLERLYSDITEEARNQYTLTFQPTGEDKSRDFHQIEVRVLRPKLNVTAREGYYQSALNVGH